MSTCTHTRQAPPYWHEEEDDWGNKVGEWREGPIESTTKDLGTGRYQCTQCGEVMYYTGRWRDLYEGKIEPTDYERKHMERDQYSEVKPFSSNIYGRHEKKRPW